MQALVSADLRPAQHNTSLHCNCTSVTSSNKHHVVRRDQGCGSGLVAAAAALTAFYPCRGDKKIMSGAGVGTRTANEPSRRFHKNHNQQTALRIFDYQIFSDMRPNITSIYCVYIPD